jgi:predicted dehydrogenase
MKSYKLAYWGSGPISNFHLPAFLEAGFVPEIVFSRSDSDRLKEFGDRWNIPVSPDLPYFLKGCNSVDAIVIALETSVTPFAISEVIRTGLPIFIEKPGGLLSADLSQFANHKNRKKLFFAYNRRYYLSASKMREFLRSNPSSFIQANFPDEIRSFDQFRINGCHMVDFLQYISGPLVFKGAWGGIEGTGNGFMVQLQSTDGHVISLLTNWGSPENVSIKISGGGRTVLSKGFENISEFDKIEIFEPNSEYPLRRYIPHKSLEVIEPVTLHKPGFQAQALSFRTFLESGEYASTDCDLSQAISVLRLIEVIEKELIQ